MAGLCPATAGWGLCSRSLALEPGFPVPWKRPVRSAGWVLTPTWLRNSCLGDLDRCVFVYIGVYVLIGGDRGDVDEKFFLQES